MNSQSISLRPLEYCSCCFSIALTLYSTLNLFSLLHYKINSGTVWLACTPHKMKFFAVFTCRWQYQINTNKLCGSLFNWQNIYFKSYQLMHRWSLSFFSLNSGWGTNCGDRQDWDTNCQLDAICSVIHVISNGWKNDILEDAKSSDKR